MRRLLSVLAAVGGFVSLLAVPGAGQCLPYGFGCNGPAQIGCGASPSIGTFLLLCARTSCGLQPNVMLLGSCGPGPNQIPAGLACSFCPRCSLDLSAIWLARSWNGTGCLGIPIPNDHALVGQSLCAQNVCAYTACVCLTNTIQVRIVR